MLNLNDLTLIQWSKNTLIELIGVRKKERTRRWIDNAELSRFVSVCVSVCEHWYRFHHANYRLIGLQLIELNNILRKKFIFEIIQFKKLI